MKKAKGVVMRTSGSKTVVLTEGGSFLEVPTPEKPPQLGQVIEFNLPSQRPFLYSAAFRLAASAAVLVLFLALGILNPFFGPGAAVAGVTLDMNGGVELTVNKQAKVVKTRNTGGGLNSVTGGLELKDRDIYEAVGLIVEGAATGGILGEDKNLVLASVTPLSSRGLNVVDEEKLRGVIHEKMLSGSISGIVVVGEAGKESKRRAEELGMTLNHYLVYERCEQKGLPVDAGAFQGGDIREVLKGAGISLLNFFPEESFEVGHGEQSPEQGGGGTATGHPAEEGDHRQGQDNSWDAGALDSNHEDSGSNYTGDSHYGRDSSTQGGMQEGLEVDMNQPNRMEDSGIHPVQVLPSAETTVKPDGASGMSGPGQEAGHDGDRRFLQPKSVVPPGSGTIQGHVSESEPQINGDNSNNTSHRNDLSSDGNSDLMKSRETVQERDAAQTKAAGTQEQETFSHNE